MQNHNVLISLRIPLHASRMGASLFSSSFHAHFISNRTSPEWGYCRVNDKRYMGVACYRVSATMYEGFICAT